MGCVTAVLGASPFWVTVLDTCLGQVPRGGHQGPHPYSLSHLTFLIHSSLYTPICTYRHLQDIHKLTDFFFFSFCPIEYLRGQVWPCSSHTQLYRASSCPRSTHLSWALSFASQSAQLTQTPKAFNLPATWRSSAVSLHWGVPALAC